MTRRSHIVITIVFLLVIAAAWISAQAVIQQPVTPPITLGGDDIQFRVESRIGNRLMGRLMVRLDGEWVEAEVNGGPVLRRLHAN